MILPGTYQNGFAPRDGEPLHADLHAGCLGVWSPSLGPTGTVLRDWSGRSNNGQFTGLSPNEAWSPCQGKTSLYFSGSLGQRVEIGRSVFSGKSVLTVSAWFMATSISTDQAIYSEAYHVDGSFSVSLRITTSKAVASFRDGTPGTTVTVTGATTLLSNVLYHIAGVFTRTNQYIFVNGVMDGSESTAMGPITSTWISTRIGVQSAGGNRQFSGFIGDLVASETVSYDSIKLLSSRRGIFHELAPVRYSGSAGFLASWRRQQSFIIGGGLQ